MPEGADEIAAAYREINNRWAVLGSVGWQEWPSPPPGVLAVREIDKPRFA